jgi:GDP-4-dehydro-6-deoxy-D-mannose reductase
MDAAVFRFAAEERYIMKVLITGITGFAGSHLADYLLARRDCEVYGLQRWRSDLANVRHLIGTIRLYECDMRDAFSVHSVIAAIRPDRIFHLAAQSFVPTSFNAPTESLTTNVLCELNLFEAVRKVGINPFIQIAGSSEEYGFVRPDEVPITEQNPFRPLSPYGVSKVGQDLLAYQYYRSYRLNVVRTRGFNHTGPRRGPVFICSDFAKQLVDIEKKKKKPVLRTGNLEAKRDFTDVRDMVKGYWLALEKGTPGEVYNICSGKAYEMREVLDLLLGFTDMKVEIQQDPQRMRPSDVPRLLGDSSKFRAVTGWKPEIPFETTLRDIMEYWRAQD